MEKETKKKKTTKNVKKKSKTKEKVVEKEIEVEVVKEEKSFFEKNKDIIVIALIALLTAVTLISTNIKKNESTEKINFINYGTITEVSNFKDTLISDYQTYETFINYYEVESKLTKVDFENHNYLVLMPEQDYCSGALEGISSVTREGDTLIFAFDIKASCGPCAPIYNLYLYELDKNTLPPTYKVNYEYNQVNTLNCDENIAYKPLIYLYPETTSTVTVELGHKEKLTTTYPEYNNLWKVVASPNGTLKYNNRTYYGLYWEGLNTTTTMHDEGFIVAGSDTASFLEEKLAILGLTDKEANEFIIYWLPKMEHNKYNYIYFETASEIEDNMPLKVTPTPDSIIRVMMDTKPLDEKITISEQQLTSPTRTGFTVVEWGGTIINN